MADHKLKPIALITGASAGLGAEFARQLSLRGHRLVLAARRRDRLDALAAELGNARAVAIDLSLPGAAAKLVADIGASGERADVLINNAGFGLKGYFAEQDPALLRQMIDLNCGALMDLCRAILPQMIEHRSGSILNVASTAAFQPGPGMAVYYATKAFVLSLSEALHEEAKPHGVKVTALCPGPTRTEFGDVAGFDDNASLARVSMDAAPVVKKGLEALNSNRAVVIPGALNSALALATRIAPRPVARKVAGALNL